MNVVIYDGDCGFCQYWIRWLLKLDRNEELMFADQYSNFFQKLPVQRTDSIMFVENHKIYFESQAIIEILSVTGYRKLAATGRLIPGIVRDGVYRMIAKYRHHLAPKSCKMMP
ncbi:thiol-disulfide oxidoreductase DCC family protein [Macrococcus lamae]|uniref:DUF393 domain-containing protein n=1 Tax=Macrococcus lamae TaxID=198484 RepID=A0A4R6BU11_9STAP|nr:DUF393 domain-containing protein [Macrococcus lamae]TDM07898.1 DUF393 domain-containing protein [Macrococcus lamae]